MVKKTMPCDLSGEWGDFLIYRNIRENPSEIVSQ